MGSFDTPPRSPEQAGFQSLQAWTKESLSPGSSHDYSSYTPYEDETKAAKISTVKVSGYVREVNEIQPVSSTRRISRVSELMEKFWLFELAALIISAIGLIGVVAILIITDGKRQPHWQIQTKYTKPLAVTINSVISLFSTLVKSTVLIPVVASLGELKWLWFGDERPLTDIQVFDEAAKGPLGSAIMLWSFRGRTLACLGAIITIGSLGLDFAFQQLVTYPLRPVDIGDAYIARTETYEAYSGDTLAGLFIPEIPMQAAIWKGFYGVDDHFDISPVCSTGNCTWKDYTSLAVRSKCYSTTDLLQKYCATSNTSGFLFPYCNYTLPSGQNISSKDAADATILDIAVLPASNDTYFGRKPSGVIATMSVIMSEWEHVDAGYFAIKSANATECGLEVCVVKYQGSVENGVFKERAVDIFANTTQLDDISKETQGGFYLAPDSVYITPPASWFTMSDTSRSETFIMDIATVAALRYRFQSQVDWTGDFTTIQDGEDPGTSQNPLVRWIRNVGLDGVNGTMAAMAASMTRQIRESAQDGNAHNASIDAIGTAIQQINHVHVRWGWIALPAAILLLSGAFLIATMVEAKRKGANMLWKSNGLAQFYHPLNREGRDKIRVANSAKHALKIAEDLKVRWQQTEAGGRFVTS